MSSSGAWNPRREGCTRGAAVVREVALPTARAVLAFGREQYGRAVDLAAPLRNDLWRLGGSRTQRDTLDLMVLEAAIRAGRGRLAQAIFAERKAAAPLTPRARVQEARAGALAAPRRAPGRRLNEPGERTMPPQDQGRDHRLHRRRARRHGAARPRQRELAPDVAAAHGAARRALSESWRPTSSATARARRGATGCRRPTTIWWRRSRASWAAPLHVIGHSYGGALALRAAIARGAA